MNEPISIAPVISHAPDFQIVMSRRCASACGYCDYPVAPSPQPPSFRAIRRLLRRATRLGAAQVTLSAGEGIENLPEIVSVCRYYGHATWWDYLRAACVAVIEERGQRVMLPVLDVGPIPATELARVREVVGSVRLMLDSGDERLLSTAAHGRAPVKSPVRRMAALEDLGHWKVPVTTGVIVGLGEDAASLDRAVRAVNGLHGRHRNIQNFVLRPFVPVARTPMERHPAPCDTRFLAAVAEARAILSPEIALTAELPASRMAMAAAVLAAGATDLGSFRIGGSERIEFGAPDALDTARDTLAAAGHAGALVERTALMPRFDLGQALPTAIGQNLELYLHSAGAVRDSHGGGHDGYSETADDDDRRDRAA